jgi:FtsP/CotA-like multicopper oxidase with cupredoxin domain
MKNYSWSMNGQVWPYVTPFKIKSNQRVEMVFNNENGMQHPMHFHGHVFQITEINGKPVNGRQGDTINVMPHTSVKVAFDSMNPGIWALHCHILYHQAGGMMTTVNYENYPDKFTLKQRVEGERLYTESMD